jgi:vacuolar-type H+-ATPase subunit C/Vma6
LAKSEGRINNRFAHADGAVRALETRLIPRAKFEHLAGIDNWNELVHELGETDYTDLLRHITPGGLEDALEEHVKEVAHLLESLTDGAISPLVNVSLESRYRWQDILTQAKLLDSKLILVYARNGAELWNLRIGLRIFWRGTTDFDINNFVGDERRRVELVRLCKQGKENFIGYWENKDFWPHINSFIGDGSTIDFGGLDRECDNWLTHICEPAKYETFGLDPLWGYWHAKLIEIVNLRIVLGGQRNQMAESNKKALLRKVYV